MIALLQSMRLHQWLKNVLLFVPFALALPQLGSRDLVTAFFSFVCLCFLTSGTYLVNDLIDVEADRAHARKRNRPIACGDLPVPVAVMASVALIGSAIVSAAFLSFALAAVLLGYLVLTLLYSVVFKRMAIIDVLAIATMFTLRIVAGMVLLGHSLSPWLLMFSIFFFTSLAFMKREVEFEVTYQAGRQAIQGRGYELNDRNYVLACGISSGMASLVVFALFISTVTEQRLSNYAFPALLWGVMAALSYWMLRMWLLTTRRLMDDDPILYAARDRMSLLLGVAVVMLAFAAQVARI